MGGAARRAAAREPAESASGERGKQDEPRATARVKIEKLHPLPFFLPWTRAGSSASACDALHFMSVKRGPVSVRESPAVGRLQRERARSCPGWCLRVPDKQKWGLLGLPSFCCLSLPHISARLSYVAPARRCAWCACSAFWLKARLCGRALKAGVAHCAALATRACHHSGLSCAWTPAFKFCSCAAFPKIYVCFEGVKASAASAQSAKRRLLTDALATDGGPSTGDCHSWPTTPIHLRSPALSHATAVPLASQEALEPAPPLAKEALPLANEALRRRGALRRGGGARGAAAAQGAAQGREPQQRNGQAPQQQNVLGTAPGAASVDAPGEMADPAAVKARQLALPPQQHPKYHHHMPFPHLPEPPAPAR